MALAVRARVVDISTDTPKNSDKFLVDTNAWYWLHYSRAAQALTPIQTLYPDYISRALGAGSELYRSSLSFSELAHNIEKTEREIYADLANRDIQTKEFRHNYVDQRRKVIAAITETWADVEDSSTLLAFELSDAFTQSALSLFPSVGLDGYDLFMAEAAIQAGVTQIVTDDGDFATVPGLKIFTANPRVIQMAQQAGKLLVR